MWKSRVTSIAAKTDVLTHVNGIPFIHQYSIFLQMPIHSFTTICMPYNNEIAII
jgi:hypothetical protein